MSAVRACKKLNCAMGFFDLFRPKWKHTDPKARFSAVKQISDQALLARIVEEDRSQEVRTLALSRIKDRAMLTNIAKNAKCSWRVRKKAVERLADEKLASFVARYDSDWRVRVAAVAQMTDEKGLQEVVRRDTGSPKVRAAAVGRLTDAGALALVALTDKDDGVRTAAESRLAGSQELQHLGKKASADETRAAMVRCITSVESLAQIALTSPDIKAAVAAAHSISDEAILVKIESSARHPAVRKIARRGIKNYKVLANIWREALLGDEDDRVDAKSHHSRLLELEEEIADRMRLLAQSNPDELYRASEDNSLSTLVREKVVVCIREERQLAKIAVFSTDIRVANCAVERLTTNAGLAAVAKQAHKVAVRESAVERLTDQAALEFVAANDKEARVREAAVQRVQSPAVRDRIAADDGDPKVRNAAKSSTGRSMQFEAVSPGGGRPSGANHTAVRTSSIPTRSSSTAPRNVSSAPNPSTSSAHHRAGGGSPAPTRSASSGNHPAVRGSDAPIRSGSSGNHPAVPGAATPPRSPSSGSHPAVRGPNTPVHPTPTGKPAAAANRGGASSSESPSRQPKVDSED